MKKMGLFVLFAYLLAPGNVALSDTIRGIDFDFVTIGNAGNPGDTRIQSDGTSGYGTVGYNYRIGKYEITNAQWDTFTAAAGVPTGDDDGGYNGYNYSAFFTGAQQPTNNVSWYEAAQFCNWLTSGDKSQGVYQFSGSNTNPGSFLSVNRTAAQAAYGKIYVIPTEDEWYKAAYFKPNGSGYSLYANGLNTIPSADNGWNYYGGSYADPWNVGAGTQEQNGTFDMMGNVFEWNETLFPSEDPLNGPYRGLRGGAIDSINNTILASSSRFYSANQWFQDLSLGFRVVSITPEPATLLLLGLGGLALRRKK